MFNKTTGLLAIVILAGVALTTVVFRKARTPDADPTDVVMAKMTELADQMCECTNRACAEVVQAAMNTWFTELSWRGAAPRAVEADSRMRDVSVRYGNCMDVAMRSPPRTVPPRTVPVAEKPPVQPAPAGIPDTCQEYGAAIEALARCSKLPQATRDALRDSYRQTSAVWPKIPADGRAALAIACGQARDAVRQSAAACE